MNKKMQNDEKQTRIKMMRIISDFSERGKHTCSIPPLKKKERKDTAPRFLPEGDDYLAASLRGRMKETKIHLSRGSGYVPLCETHLSV